MKRKSVKFIALLLMVLFAITLVVGCSGGETKKEEPKAEEPKKEEVKVETTVLKIAHTLVADHPYHAGLVEFGKILKEKTNGKYSVEIYPAAQLGSERESIEGVQMGTIDLTLVSTEIGRASCRVRV